MIKLITYSVLWSVVCMGLVVQAGCALMVNPNYDELSSRPVVLTPSERGVREASVTPNAQQVRPFESITCAAHTGSIIHGPLFFEDPYVLGGSDDGQFAWTLEEPLYYLLGPIRYGINLASLPISGVVSPLWVPVKQADTMTARQEVSPTVASNHVEATP